MPSVLFMGQVFIDCAKKACYNFSIKKKRVKQKKISCGCESLFGEKIRSFGATRVKRLDVGKVRFFTANNSGSYQNGFSTKTRIKKKESTLWGSFR